MPVLALLLATLATDRFPQGTARMQLGPGHASGATASCTSCHEAETAAWAASGHASARVNFVFRASLTKDEPEWCVGCHAPLATKFDRSVPPADAPAEERGIGCSACHAPATDGTPAPKGNELCATCHQFGFALPRTTGAIRISEAKVQQDTFEEWKRWSAAAGDARGCVECHMAGGDHAFGGVHRTEALRRAVAVTVVDGGRALEVRTRDTGHRLPTGDIMRWLSLEAAADPLFEEPVVVARFVRELARRRWEPDEGPYLGVLRSTALPDSAAAPVRVALPPRDARGRRLVAWRLVYHLVSEAQENEGMLDPSASRVVLDAGHLGAPR